MAIKGKIAKEEIDVNHDETKLNKKNLNEVIGLSKKILKVMYLFIIFAGIYAFLMIGKEISLFSFLGTLFKIVSPLFIGLVMAWLFDPLVKMLKKKGIKRQLGAVIVYVGFIVVILFVLWVFVPMISEQLNEFAKNIPTIFESIKNWISTALKKLEGIKNFDVNDIELQIFSKIENFGKNLAVSLPELTVNILTTFFSGLGNILVGLIIGFYLLVSFDDAAITVMELLPKKIHKDVHAIYDDINTSLRRFVQGALIDCSLVFVVSSLGLMLVGLKSPLLFGLFCGITNIIPYAGPYIGGAPAVIVGFVQSPLTGILTLVVIAIIQFIEGNFFQPIIMSKTTKLNPVTIMLGLLVFGHFWGIIGMVISTPVIAALKAIIKYFDDKYDIIKFN